MVILIPVLVLGFLGACWLLFGERLRNPTVGVADLDGAGTRQDTNALRNLHKALITFADNQVSGDRRKGIAHKLEMSGSNMRPGEWVVLVFVVTLAAAAIGALTVHPVIGIVAGALSFALFKISLSRKVDKRQSTFDSQLGETLQLLAGALRAGLSLPQALNVVATEAPSPSGEEYRRVLAESRLGRDTTDALYAMAARIGSQDFEWVVGAIDINRQAGGDLSVILDRVVHTIRQRERVRGQVKALSAEGKLSGVVMGLLPPGVLVFVSITNPGYMDSFTSGGFRGWFLLGVSGFLLFLGLIWLKKLTKFTY